MTPGEWDNLGTMVCFHRQYNLGDTDTGYDLKDYESWKDLASTVQKEENTAIMIPLRLYDHSGISISTSGSYPYNCRWDSMQIGFIFISKKKVMEEYSVKKISKALLKKVANRLEDEVKTYDQYLIGDIYTIVKETYDKDKHQLEYDCVSGYFGYEHAQKSLKTEI